MREADLAIAPEAVKAPIDYVGSLFNSSVATERFNSLWNELEWVDVAGPRREYYCHDNNAPYTYGRGIGTRTYQAQPYHPVLRAIRSEVEARAGCKFEVLFLNGYRDGSDHLGWHSDDSVEMDPNRPIAIVSLGARRQIMFREVGSAESERVWLDHGSLCLMKAGMQSTHQHRIPKAGFVCGPRISLTFRGATPM